MLATLPFSLALQWTLQFFHSRIATAVIRPIYIVVLVSAVKGSFDVKRAHCN